MSLGKIFLIVSLVLATLTQAASAFLAGTSLGFPGNVWWIVLAVVSPGILCGLGLRRGHLWVGTVFFLWAIGFALYGIVYDFSAVLLLVSLCLALGFWDLTRFERRMGSQVERERLSLVEKRHLQQLFITLGTGFVVALATLLIRFELNFILELLLALALLFGISQLVRILRQLFHP